MVASNIGGGAGLTAGCLPPTEPCCSHAGMWTSITAFLSPTLPSTLCPLTRCPPTHQRDHTWTVCLALGHPGAHLSTVQELLMQHPSQRGDAHSDDTVPGRCAGQ